MDQVRAELIKGQIKKAEEKLSAAKSLREDGFQDDAISRAYYVMFHAGSAALLSEGIAVESHNPALYSSYQAIWMASKIPSLDFPGSSEKSEREMIEVWRSVNRMVRGSLSGYFS